MLEFAPQTALLGGCCGTTPQHIKALVESCAELPPPEKRNGAPECITGYGAPVCFDRMPVIIGERINPTGKKRLKEALKAGDMDYVCQLALEQHLIGFIAYCDLRRLLRRAHTPFQQVIHIAFSQAEAPPARDCGRIPPPDFSVHNRGCSCLPRGTPRP